ncbi:MAG: Ig-like domain repeat protein [Anaerolineales bacterium]|nr:Ig-like domain repeat protein [Anaerolineales bacterium]
MTSTPNPADTQTTVTLTATVATTATGLGVPGGYVTFTVGSDVFTATLNNGIAVAHRTILVVGSHPVATTYAGDDDSFTGAATTGANLLIQAILTTGKDGTGAGAVTSDPAGIDCGIACVARFDPNTFITLTATPPISSTFAGWSGDAGGTTNPLTVTLNGDKAITATFTLKTYVITPTAEANGSITPSTPQRVNYGADQVFTIAADPHYHVIDVAADSVSVGAVDSYTFTNVTADHIITASFAIDSHSLSLGKAGSGDGTVANDPAGSRFDYGTVVTITATPLISSTFTGWSGDATGATSPLTVTIDSDKAITATFARNGYPLTLGMVGTGGGALANDPAGSVFDYGTVVTVTATPYISSTFTGWSGDATGATNPLVVTMDVTRAITASFTLKTYVITPTAGANGITPNTPQTVNYGVDQVFTIAANPHHHILDVAIDGVSVGATNVYTFAHVTANHTITASFAIDMHSLSLYKTGTGGGIVANDPAGGSFAYGTVVTVTATPLISSTFTGWSGDASGSTNPLVVTMDAAKAITATFTLKTFVITPTAGANGSITPSTPQTLNYGSDQTFTIAADPHHHILDVAADGVSVGALDVYTFTNVTTDHIITASFTIDIHSLSLHKDGTGDGTVDNEPAGSSFAYGTVVTITATTPISSIFTGWSGDAEHPQTLGATAPSTPRCAPILDVMVDDTHRGGGCLTFRSRCRHTSRPSSPATCADLQRRSEHGHSE